MMNIDSEAVAQRCSVEKAFLEISQNSQENTCARVFFNKVTGFNQQFYEFVNFSEHLSLENTSGGCFWVMNIDSTNRTE